MADILHIEVLADGTLKITTDGVSAANHMNAEAFISHANKLMGGTSTRTKRLDVHHSLTNALHEHAKDGHTHEGHEHTHQ
jgi:hypothetical protein